MHRSPPGVAKNIQIRKIQRYEKSDTDISDLIIEYFGGDKSYQKLYFKQLVSLINFLFCIVLPPVAPKFIYFLDLIYTIQFFQIWPDSILIEMTDVNNDIYNNFEYHNQFSKLYRFLCRREKF